MEVIKDVLDHPQFLKQFTIQQLRSRYRGSVLGYLWALLTPLLMFVAFAGFFRIINPNANTFLPEMLTAYTAWMFFVNAVGMSVYSLVANAVYITRVRSPKIVFPLSGVLVALVELGGFLVALFVLLALLGVNFSPTMLLLPFAIALLAVFAAGFCFLMAAMNVFLRDVGLFWGPLSLIWLLCTPIFFRITEIPPQARPVIEANPMYPYVTMFQDLLYRGTLPSAETIVMGVLYAVIMFMFGATVFMRSQKSFYSYV